MDAITIKPVTGGNVLPYLDAVAHLRIEVFREYPYLYDGSLHYEKEYLQTYAQAERSLFVLALKGDHVVGVSTAIPMVEGDAEFMKPFEDAGYNLEEILYFGESVLQKEYRGQGHGKAFFDEREAHAHRLGCTITTFCAVDRPSDHPLRPAGHRPLDGFWEKRGYTRHPELVAHYPWKDIDEDEETSKPLTFWIRKWS